MEPIRSINLPPSNKAKRKKPLIHGEQDSLSRFVTTNSRTFVSKPGWGYEDWIANSDLYCGKILFFKQGRHCSVHYHLVKDETFYLLDGELEVTVLEPDYWERASSDPWTEEEVQSIWVNNDDVKSFIMRPGDSFHLPVRMIHTMKGLMDSHLMEVSMKHVEEDSIRLIKGD